MTDLILTEDDYRQLVQSNDGKPTTDSLKVADKFGKRHDNVLRSIDNLKCSEKFRLLNFEEIFYHDEYGRPQRMFTMTKDGYMYLVMGLTGMEGSIHRSLQLDDGGADIPLTVLRAAPKLYKPGVQTGNEPSKFRRQDHAPLADQEANHRG